MKKVMTLVALALTTMIGATPGKAQSEELPLKINDIRQELMSYGPLEPGTDFTLSLLETAAKQCPNGDVSVSRELTESQDSELAEYTARVSCATVKFHELPAESVSLTAIFAQYGNKGSIYLLDLESRIAIMSIDPIGQ